MSKNVPGSTPRNRTVFAALFAALIALTCVIAIPGGPLGVPIVLQNMMAVLAGAVLGPLTGVMAVFLFLAAGALGLPVFSGGSGGIARLMGPTGGFLLGYLLAALTAGLILGLPKTRPRKTTALYLRAVFGVIAGYAVIYLAGVPWLTRILMARTSSSFGEALPGALAAGIIPFIPADLLKIALSIPLVLALRPIAARYINPDV